MKTTTRKAGQPLDEASGQALAGLSRRQSGILDSLPKLAIPMLLVATFILFSALSPHLFLTWTNIRITVGAQATTLLLAVAITITLRTGDIDLSVAGVMVFSAALVGVLYGDGMPAWLACLIAILAGLAVGLVNSLFVVGVGLDGLIVTLGVFTLIGGITTGISGGNLVNTIPQSLQDFANHRFLSLPMVVWIGWIIAAVAWLMFEFTPLGRYLLFIGGNRPAATLAGLRVSRFRIFAFVTTAVISAVAGVLLAGSLGSVDPSSSTSYLLAPVTAAFLGTTTIQMGRFNIIGTLVGLYLIAFGVTGLQLLGLQGWVTDVFNGAALVLALAFAHYFEVLRVGRFRFGRTAKQAPATVEAAQE
jgi:ribose transport system permease protein